MRMSTKTLAPKMTIRMPALASTFQTSPSFSLRKCLHATVVATVLSCALFALTAFLIASQHRLNPVKLSPRQLPHRGWVDTNVSSASQGKLWYPTVFRSFQHPTRSTRLPTNLSSLTTTTLPTASCSTWAVVTTIFEPTDLLRQLRNLSEICVVVVGDRKTDHVAFRRFEQDSPANQTVYLSDEDQENLPFRSIEHIPWNHFGRKNIGYLYAISRGAQYIWDTDDDNALRSESHLLTLTALANSSAKVPVAGISVDPVGTTHIWNPYPAFKPLSPRSAKTIPDAWPRGLPLQFVHSESIAEPALSTESISATQVGVFQALANNDPDVDAIFRLTREIPVVFQNENMTIALPHGRVSPFNAQASLWSRKAFWGLLLPVTVHGRVSDIWRSYFTQRLMADVGLHTAFTSPVVNQVRNVHSLVADLHAEVPLYTQADELIRWLQRWEAKGESGKSLLKRMEKLAMDLYEIGVIGEEDVLLTQSWLDDLEGMGYGEEGRDGEVAKVLKKTSGESLPKAAEAIVENQPNVAVCVSGQIRTLTLKPEDDDHPNKWQGMKSSLGAPNMTVAESIQQVLYPKLGKPDVFMVVSTKETEHEPKVGDTSVCEPMRPRNGGHLSCEVLKEKDVIVSRWEMWEEFFMVKVEKRKDLVQGLLQQLKGMWQCHAAIQKHSKRTGKVYDWIVRMRPDNYMVEFPSLERLSIDAKVPTVWYGSFKYCCCGNEDRFGISRADWMREYFDRFMYLQTWDWDWPGSWNAEAYLQKVMDSFGVKLMPHPDIHLCTVKPLHRKSRSDP